MGAIDILRYLIASFFPLNEFSTSADNPSMSTPAIVSTGWIALLMCWVLVLEVGCSMSGTGTKLALDSLKTWYGLTD